MNTPTVTLRSRAVLAVGALSAASLFATAPVVSAASGDVIQAGVGIDDLQIGMTRSQVVANYSQFYCSSGPNCYVPGDGGYARVYFSNERVNHLEFTDGDYAGWDTSVGIGFDTTKSQASAILGQPVVRDSNNYGFVTDQIQAPDKGYTIEYLYTTYCTDSGCRVTGERHRHHIYAPEGGTTPPTNPTTPPTTVVENAPLEVDGTINITNDTNRRLRRRVRITVTDGNGTVVASVLQRVNLRRGQSVDIDPTTLIDVDEVGAGTYSWSADFTRRRRVVNVDSGTFSVVAGS